MSKKMTIAEAEEKRLGLVGWIKARRIKLWKGDPGFRLRVSSSVSKALEGKEFFSKVKPKITKQI